MIMTGGCFFFMKIWYAVRNQLAGGTELWTISGIYWIMRRSRELSTVKEKQPDGSVRIYVDEDLKQKIALKLLEEIPNFPLEETERVAKEETEGL